jgi:Ca2+-binding RTX toxin-like protein
MAGGAGNDTYIVDNAGDAIVEWRGRDRHGAELGQFHAGCRGRKPDLTGAAAINGTGNALNNTITGNLAANVLDGGAGADAMAGGAGNDTYIVDNASDTVVEAADGGTDTVQSSDQPLTAEVEI